MLYFHIKVLDCLKGQWKVLTMGLRHAQICTDRPTKSPLQLHATVFAEKARCNSQMATVWIKEKQQTLKL